MEDVNNVCDYIIVKLTEGGRHLNILKLQKILYYVQAWNLAFAGRRAFNDSFQAWVHGPVSRTIYDRFSITKSLYSFVSVADVRSGFNPFTIDQDVRARIDSVLEIYGDFTGDQLEEMTHNEDPWIKARAGIAPALRCENQISDRDMAIYYGNRVQINRQFDSFLT